MQIRIIFVVFISTVHLRVMLMIMILHILLQKFYKLIYRQLPKKKSELNIYLLCFRHQIHSLLHQFKKVI